MSLLPSAHVKTIFIVCNKCSVSPSLSLNVDLSNPGTSDKYSQQFSTLPNVDDQFVFSPGFTGKYSLGS